MSSGSSSDDDTELVSDGLRGETLEVNSEHWVVPDQKLAGAQGQHVRVYYGGHTEAEKVRSAENTLSLLQGAHEQECQAAPAAVEQNQLMEAAKAWRAQMAIFWAMRIVRYQMTLSTYRAMISEQHAVGLNKLLSHRLQPTYDEVRLIITEIYNQMALMLDFRTVFLPDTGEAGIMMPSSIVAWVLRNADLRSCCTFPRVPNAVAILVGEGEVKSLDQILYVLTIPIPPGGTIDDVLDTRKSYINGRQVVLYFRENAEENFADMLLGQLGTDDWSLADWVVRPVWKLWLRILIDAGARIGRVAGTTGQCLCILSFKGMHGFENNLIPNAFAVAAMNGEDSHENVNDVLDAWSRPRDPDFKDDINTPCRPSAFIGASAASTLREDLDKMVGLGLWVQTQSASGAVVWDVYDSEVEYGGDSKFRSGVQGKVSPMGYFCCAGCTATKASCVLPGPAGTQCEVRHLQDVNEGGNLTFGQITIGGLLTVINGLYTGGQMLWKHQHFAALRPYFRMRNASSGFADDPIQLGDDHTDAVMYALAPEQIAKGIGRWCNVSVQYVKIVQQLKKKLKDDISKLPANNTEMTLDFVRKAHRRFVIAAQDPTIKFISLPETLKAVAREITRGVQIVTAQRERYANAQGPAQRAGLEAKFDAALEAMPEGICAAYNKTPAVVAEIGRILAELGGQTTANLPPETLLACRKLCVARKKGGGLDSDLAMYAIANGEVRKRMKWRGQGMNASMTFDRRLLWGPLHGFQIRGWATLLSHIGCLISALGCGPQFEADLNRQGMPCKYTIIKTLVVFGLIKWRGYDSKKVMFNPEVYFRSVPLNYQRLIVLAVRLWGCMWHLVTNPWLEDTFFMDLPRDFHSAMNGTDDREITITVTGLLGHAECNGDYTRCRKSPTVNGKKHYVNRQNIDLYFHRTGHWIIGHTVNLQRLSGVAFICTRPDSDNIPHGTQPWTVLRNVEGDTGLARSKKGDWGSIQVTVSIDGMHDGEDAEALLRRLEGVEAPVPAPFLFDPSLEKDFTVHADEWESAMEPDPSETAPATRCSAASRVSAMVALSDAERVRLLLPNRKRVQRSIRAPNEPEEQYFAMRLTNGNILFNMSRRNAQAGLVEANIIDVGSDGPKTWKLDEMLVVGPDVARVTRYLRERAGRLNAALQRPKGTLVTCFNGRSRSPTVICAWLMIYCHEELEDARNILLATFAAQRQELVRRSAHHGAPNFEKFRLALELLSRELAEGVEEYGGVGEIPDAASGPPPVEPAAAPGPPPVEPAAAPEHPFIAKPGQRRRLAEQFVRRLADSLKKILHHLFGRTKSLYTPTMHEVLEEVVRDFCDLHLDVYWGREDVVEAAQVCCSVRAPYYA
jgi:hypothetical protein